MIYRARNFLAALVLLVLVAAGLGVWTLVASPMGGVAHAAAPTVNLKPASIVWQKPLTRRESIPPTNGPAPLTGPASAFEPLVIPGWGPNYRANTDTQNPNLAQQEPSIAINPTNPLNVVAAAKDERAGINTKQVWIYTSTDGGVTWINQQFPLASPASPYSSDPVVSFSYDGQVYVTALPYGGSSMDGIQVARSTDSGITFSTGVHLPGSNGGSDKEWTWVDNFPASPYYHRIYNTWYDYNQGNVFSFNYSSDRGVSWSNKITVGPAEQFPMPVVFPNGDVFATYYGFSGGVEAKRSTNGGQTWGSALPIAPITDPHCPPDNSGCHIWRLNAIPSTSVSPVNGDSVIAWADGQQGTATIYYTRSTDNGATWSAAAVLAPPGAGNVYQVEPWVTADDQGTFHAIWYDDRDNPNTSIFNIFYSQSTDNGVTWSTAESISTATSDLRIGIPGGYALAAGDYINVTAWDGNVYGAWTDTRSGTGEDIYTVRGIIPQGTPTPTITGTPPTDTPTVTSSPTTIATSPPATATSTLVAETATSTAQATSTTLETATSTSVVSATPTTCVMSFTDVSSTDWFYDYVYYLFCHGVINGYNTSPPCAPDAIPCFNPGGTTTRGQLSKIAVLGFNVPINTAGGPHFSDVQPGDTFYDYVETLFNLGAISGYDDGTFRPNNFVTRGQLTKIVVNTAVLLGRPGWHLINPTNNTFQDVLPDNPFYDYIETAFANGVIGGYPCGTPPAGECVPPDNKPYFLPFANATRAEISKIAFLAITYTPPAVPKR